MPVSAHPSWLNPEGSEASPPAPTEMQGPLRVQGTGPQSNEPCASTVSYVSPARRIIHFACAGVLAIVAVKYGRDAKNEIEKVLGGAQEERGLQLREAEVAEHNKGKPPLPDIQEAKKGDHEFVLDGHRHVVYAEVGEKTRQWVATYHVDEEWTYFARYDRYGPSAAEQISRDVGGARQSNSERIGFDELPSKFQHFLQQFEPDENEDPELRKLGEEALAAIREAIAQPPSPQ